MQKTNQERNKKNIWSEFDANKRKTKKVRENISFIEKYFYRRENILKENLRKSKLART